MNVLCTDKTGTITIGTVSLYKSLDLMGVQSDEVQRLAHLNSALQSGFPNPIDLAIINASEKRAITESAVAEIPYDFQRRRLSILTSAGLMITKGAVESLFRVTTYARVNGEVVSWASVSDKARARFEEISSHGYRVLAVATRNIDGPAITLDDEREMIFEGFLV
jgi:P-type Mg2+ transporter